MTPPTARLRTLVLVLGDQLDLDAAAFDDFDPTQDAVWMAEVTEESTHVWSTQPRIALFLAAMRHFAQALQAAGRPVHYARLDDDATRATLADQLRADIARLAPQRLALTAPGDWRVLQALRGVAREAGLPLVLHDDRHFFSTVRDFAVHARRHRTLRMETFYREQRQRHQVLMQASGEPVGARWNFDADNRQAFSADGPGWVPEHPSFAPDDITRDVMTLVRRRFASHPGRLDAFDWPVTRAQALQALQRFVDERLPLFGPYQDAMWPRQPWLYHSQLAAALNLKLLTPREVIAAAVDAHEAGHAPLAGVEGFVRQILGWREYVRGVYWTQMPGYVQLNALDAQADLPGWYWTGHTDMACLRDALSQTLDLGYAHHIQRLMVTGLYALLLGAQPQQVHAWYLAVYVDAVEWVELPNTLGMSQFADGGLMASKPYIATGQYIDRMSGYCATCRFNPKQRTGEQACPFTTLHGDFLLRHADRFANHPRIGMQVRQVQRWGNDERRAVRQRADQLRAGRAG